MMTYVSYFKTIITTVTLNTAKLSFNTTEKQLSHEIRKIKVLLIMTYVPHFKSITFAKTISHKI
jgi:pentose-5-phosphate-3-epimerase